MRRNLLAAVVGVAAIIALGGCQATQKANVGAVNPSAAASSTADTTATSTSPAPAATTASVGQALTLTGDGGLQAAVTVVSVKSASAGTGALAQPPQNGVYVVADVLIEVQAGSYAFNPLYFHFQSPDGTTYSAFDGNGMTAGFQPMLDSGTLAAGQRTRGVVVFDVPAPHGQITLSDPLDSQIGGWSL